MIYSHKPQRSGRSISVNSNNPPQDPPPKPITLDDALKVPFTQIPDVFIEDTTPPVPEICECKTQKPNIIPKKVTKLIPVKKISWFRQIFDKIWRKK